MSSLALLAGENLRRVKRVICFASGKGGVGKSVLCCASALRLGPGKVGVLDLDLHGPSVPSILGVSGTPREERGLLPVEGRGLKVFSMGFLFDTCPLLGPEISEALLEILAIVRWGELDFLLVDLPPGMGEEILDLLPFKPQFVVVVTPSVLAWQTANKLLRLLRRARAEIPGVVENMCTGRPRWAEEVSGMGLKHSWVGFDPQVEASLGEGFPPQRLYEDVGRMLSELGVW
jgi:ATP-binding protein involved in chromosome partitioning